jgi:cell division protein FtsQ
MRRVTLAARRASQYIRRPPRPRWHGPAIRGATLALALATASAAGLWSTRSGALERLGAAFTGRVLALTAAAGLALRDVYVEGRVRTDPEVLRAQLGVERGQPIFGVDPDAARARLEQLPWVERANVTRMLPDGLRVRLIERQPLALWQRAGRFVLIDRTGAVIPAAEREVEEVAREGELRVLVGEEAPRHAAELFALLSTEPGLLARVVAASWVGERRWTLHLDNRIDVLLPEYGVGTVWRTLGRRARENALLQRAVSVIDLRLLPERIRLQLAPPPEGRGA